MAEMIGRKGRTAADRAKAAIGDAMERDIKASGLSAHQIAWSVGLADEDQDGKRSVATLYKAIEGDRKFPHWLWGAWRKVTGELGAIDAICRDAGGVFVDMPDATASDDKALVRCIAEFSELTQEITACRLAASDSGVGVSEAEAERIQKAGFDSIRATLELMERHKAEPAKTKSVYAGSLQEAARMQLSRR